MIAVNLIGGLGNQLFQYAVGRHLAHIHQTELKLDISHFKDYRLREYALKPYSIAQNFFQIEDRERISHIVTERQFHFEPKVLELSDRVYLKGHWQTEKYFLEISDIIKKKVTVKTPQAGQDKIIADQIATTQSVSVHIRRGDYVTNPHTNQVHGTCDLNYYRNCAGILKKLIPDPCFFIFSDDPQWAKDNLNLNAQMIVVDHNDASKDYEDLRLLSQCRHHIIANSTFSWWGAWLSHNPEKVVFAPKKWFRGRNYNTKDLYPEAWILV